MSVHLAVEFAWRHGVRLKRSHPTIRSIGKRRQNAPFPSRPSPAPLDHLWSATAACPTISGHRSQPGCRCLPLSLVNGFSGETGGTELVRGRVGDMWSVTGRTTSSQLPTRRENTSHWSMSGDDVGLPAVTLTSYGRRGDRASRPCPASVSLAGNLARFGRIDRSSLGSIGFGVVGPTRARFGRSNARRA
jgi:hypothetical protein